MNEKKENLKKIHIKLFEKLNIEQKNEVRFLQSICFTKVSEEEAREDFYHTQSAQVLAYVGEKLIAWAGIHETEQLFQGRKIKIGGYAICTHPDWQRQGIAKKVSKRAMDFLKKREVEIGFLSIDPLNKASVKLHQKNGFVMLPRKFSWTNSNGEFKTDFGGMIAPINSEKLFEYVLHGSEIFYVGNGYW
jgi:RimJ/RimL family protein N-acetyltransferase